jgi:hypothetical protein
MIVESEGGPRTGLQIANERLGAMHVLQHGPIESRRFSDGVAFRPGLRRRADSEEKREPASDIDTGVVDSLKALDPDGRLEKRTLCRHRRMTESGPEAVIDHRPTCCTDASLASAP